MAAEEKPVAQAAARVPAGERGQMLVYFARGILDNVMPVVMLLLVWELSARLRLMNPALFPPISAILETILNPTSLGTLLADVGHSLRRLALGLALAVGLGTLAGLVLGYVKMAERWLIPLFQFFISIPGVAIFPLAVLWWGLSEKAVIYTVAMEAGITISFNVWTGVKTIPEVLIHAARSMEIRGWRLYWRTLIPAALPVIMTGYRIGLSRAWRILVAGEMLAAAGNGLGYRIFEAGEFLAVEIMYGGVIIIGLLGLLLERTLLRGIERYTVERWGMLR